MVFLRGKGKAAPTKGTGLLTPLDEHKERAPILNEETLKEITSKLVGDPHSNYSGSSVCGSSRGSGQIGELAYTKFTIGGFPGVKHAVFISEGTDVNPAVFAHICKALGKEVPNLLLSGVGPIRHPSRLCSPQLLQCRGFRPLLAEVVPEPPAAGGLWAACACAEPAEAPTLDEPARMLASSVYQQKLQNATSVLASAAAQVNTWTLTGPRLSELELLLQQGLWSGSQVDIVHLVVAHLQDKAYMESSASKALLKRLFDSSEAMSAEAVDRAPLVSLPGELWGFGSTSSSPPARSTGGDMTDWSFDTYDDEAARGHPVTRWPWPCGDLFLFFYRRDMGGATRGPDWNFMTSTWLDQRAIRFAPESVAAVANVFIGGKEKSMKKSLFHALKVPRPVVVLHNTGGLSQQLGLFVGVIQRVWDGSPASARPFLAEGGLGLGRGASREQLLQAMAASRILAHIEREFDASGLHEEERLTLSDVVHLMDIIKRRARAFNQRVCALDPLSESPEGAIPAIASVLSYHKLSKREPKSVVIQRSLALKGWRLHRRLAQRAVQLEKFGTGMATAIAMTLLLSTVLACCFVAMRVEKDSVKDVFFNVTAPTLTHEVKFSFTLTQTIRLARWSLIVLPLTVALLMSLQILFQISHKRSRVQMAAVQVVSEINYFLSRTGPYSGVFREDQKRFMRHMQGVVKRLANAGVQEDDLLGGRGSFSDGFPEDTQQLAQHVEQHVYGQKALPECVQAAAWGAWLEAQAPQDYAAELSAEQYVELRLQPLKRHCEDRLRERTLRRRVLGAVLALSLLALNVGLLVAVSLGWSLDASLVPLWIPVCMGFAAFLQGLGRRLAPPEALHALGTALSAVQELDMRWQAADVRERRSDRTLRRMVLTGERMWLAMAACLAGAPLPEEDDWDAVEGEQLPQQGSPAKRSSSLSRHTSSTGSPSETDLLSDTTSMTGSTSMW